MLRQLFISGLALCAFPTGAVQAQDVTTGPGALLRVLDKTASETRDLTLLQGQSGMMGSLRVTLNECRFPTDNPTGEAYALIDVFDDRQGGSVFSGWMIASAPALSALEHQRYDVWVIRCTTS
jgi:hypothetical protein